MLSDQIPTEARRLVPEQDDFRAALRFCRDDQPDRAVFCNHLAAFWETRARLENPEPTPPRPDSARLPRSGYARRPRHAGPERRAARTLAEGKLGDARDALTKARSLEFLSIRRLAWEWQIFWKESLKKPRRGFSKSSPTILRGGREDSIAPPGSTARA